MWGFFLLYYNSLEKSHSTIKQPQTIGITSFLSNQMKNEQNEQ